MSAEACTMRRRHDLTASTEDILSATLWRQDANDEQLNGHSAAQCFAFSAPLSISAMNFCTMPRLIRETLQPTAAIAAYAAAYRNLVSTFE